MIFIIISYVPLKNHFFQTFFSKFYKPRRDCRVPVKHGSPDYTQL